MPDLRATIESLAEQFAAGVLEAIRGASLDDIVAATAREGGREGRRRRESGPGRPASPPPSKRRPRPSAQHVAALAEGIVALVKQHPKGLRAEQIRAELGIAKNQWMRPLALALESKKLTKKGEKWSTTYFPA